MLWKLWLDDLFALPDDSWLWAKTVLGAKKLIKENGVPRLMHLDHDLGDTEDALVFLKWLVELDLDGGIDLSHCSLGVHSKNPIGKNNLLGLWESYALFKMNG